LTYRRDDPPAAHTAPFFSVALKRNEPMIPPGVLIDNINLALKFYKYAELGYNVWGVSCLVASLIKRVMKPKAVYVLEMKSVDLDFVWVD
jgi:hypothetical protein